MKIKPEFLLGFQNGKTFSVRLHQSILNAVVNHLDEVSGATRSYMTPAAVGRGRQGLEYGRQALDSVALASDHQAVPLFQAPDAAAGPHINKLHSVLGNLFGSPQG